MVTGSFAGMACLLPSTVLLQRAHRSVTLSRARGQPTVPPEHHSGGTARRVRAGGVGEVPSSCAVIGILVQSGADRLLRICACFCAPHRRRGHAPSPRTRPALPATPLGRAVLLLPLSNSLRGAISSAPCSPSSRPCTRVVPRLLRGGWRVSTGRVPWPLSAGLLVAYESGIGSPARRRCIRGPSARSQFGCPDRPNTCGHPLPNRGVVSSGVFFAFFSPGRGPTAS
jgi:hypothetical protein